MVFKTYHLFQLFSFITALFCFRGLKEFKLTAYIPLLVVVCLFELIAANYFLFGWKTNYGVYDIYMIISTPFLLHGLYYMLLYKGMAKWLFIATSVCLVLFLIFNTFVLQGLQTIDTYSFFATESVLVIFSFLAILRLFLDDDTTIMLNGHPYFWLNAVNILFGIGVIFILGLSGYIRAHKVQLYGHNIYRYVTQALNYIMYLGYAYGFILCRKLTTKSS